jgi:hypothetical protein
MHRRTSIALSALAIVCAIPAHASPFFLSIDYRGDANVGPLSFTQVPISVQAKGLTDDITVEQTSQGLIRTIPVSMVITVEGAGSLDIYNDLFFFVFADVGFAGFGTSLRDASFMLAAPDVLTGYDFTTSIDQGAILNSGGIPAQILNTVLGPISLGAAGPGTITTAVINPAPGSAVALGLALASASLRRRWNRASE